MHFFCVLLKQSWLSCRELFQLLPLFFSASPSPFLETKLVATMSSKDNTANHLLTLAIAMGSTAVATYFYTASKMQNRYLEEKKESYERELRIKEKTVQARLAAGERPAFGTLVDDVSIQRVYLWECEDLKKRFEPAKKENVMRNITELSENYFFPTLKLATSMSTDEDEEDRHKKRETPYNKLITNHECILSNLVR